MAVYRRGKIWWYKFVWNGESIRESTKQSNKRSRKQMEAAHRTSLAKGEVGIRDRVPAPTLKDFAERDFTPYIESRFADKPRTLAYYRLGMKNVLEFPALCACSVEDITQDAITAFVAKKRDSGLEVSSINRQMEVMRRMRKLAVEWGKTEKALPMVRMLPGERRRERVLSPAEESKYLEAVRRIGDEILRAYERALDGIRATKRGEEPIRPRDPYLLHDLSTLLLDCALRPEEAYRLRWDQIRDGALHIWHGKTENSRRVIPLPPRTAALIEMRRGTTPDGWVFPAPTGSGHIEQFSVKGQHGKACKLAGIVHFPPYTLRHTCLTRWADVMDPYTLAYLAGHSDFATTRRYVHPRKETVLAAMQKAQDAQGGHKSGHSGETTHLEETSAKPTIN